VAAEGQETRLVALDEGFESGLVTTAGEGYKPLVALESEQGRAPAKRGYGNAVL
jgi:hypothetical protein